MKAVRTEDWCSGESQEHRRVRNTVGERAHVHRQRTVARTTRAERGRGSAPGQRRRHRGRRRRLPARARGVAARGALAAATACPRAPWRTPAPPPRPAGYSRRGHGPPAFGGGGKGGATRACSTRLTPRRRFGCNTGSASVHASAHTCASSAARVGAAGECVGGRSVRACLAPPVPPRNGERCTSGSYGRGRDARPICTQGGLFCTQGGLFCTQRGSSRADLMHELRVRRARGGGQRLLEAPERLDTRVDLVPVGASGRYGGTGRGASGRYGGTERGASGQYGEGWRRGGTMRRV